MKSSDKIVDSNSTNCADVEKSEMSDSDKNRLNCKNSKNRTKDENVDSGENGDIVINSMISRNGENYEASEKTKINRIVRIGR